MFYGTYISFTAFILNSGKCHSMGSGNTLGIFISFMAHARMCERAKHLLQFGCIVSNISITSIFSQST